MKHTDDGYELSTGRRIEALWGILGLRPTDGAWMTRLTSGHDQELYEGAESAPDIGIPLLTSMERREISEYMIGLWREWGGLADGR